MDLYKVRQQLSLGISLTSLSLRVTYYSRVSTDDVKQKHSLCNQIRHFDDMIEKNKNWNYVSGYVDDGITGTSDVKRDNFMRMIEDGKSGKFDLIITKEISRFSRNTLDSIKYTRELLQCGVAVLFVNDNINTVLPDSELRLTIMASMAQDEIRRLSERVKFGMNRAIIDGHILGNDRLFGYNKNKITGNLEIDDYEGEIIRKIYNMYVIEDMSINKIVNYLNDNNIRTSFYNKFSVSTLSRMLRNPKYKGYYCGKKSEVIDYMTKKVKYFCMDEWVMYEDKMRIPPIVSEEMWGRAFEKLRKRSKKFGKEFKDKIMYQNRYPLSARIFCDNHNTVFYRRKLSRNSEEIVWCCSEYLAKGKCTCDTPKIRQSELYLIFDDIINSLSINLDEVIKMLFNLYRVNKKNISTYKQLKKQKKEKEKVNSRKDKILELNMLGILSDNEFKEKNDKYNSQISKIDDNINELIRFMKNFDDNDEELRKILEQKIVTNDVKNRLVDLLLNRIVVSKVNNDKNNIGLKIFFNISYEYVKNEMGGNVDRLNCFFRKDYEFKRGFDKVSTKRYSVKYKVDCYFGSFL